MEDNSYDSKNPFHDPSDRKFRRSSNSRSFFDEPEPSPNNPFLDNTTSRPGVYKRGGHNNGQTNGTGSHRQELFGAESEPKTKSLFDEDEDDFDVDAPFDADEYRQKMLRKKIKESANRQINSQQRSLAVIEDSEQMGVSTAEALSKQGEQLDNIELKTDDICVTLELLRQREQLENVERKSHEIHKTMDTSTKHIDKLGSIFGGLRGWFKKKEEVVQEPTIPRRDSGLKDTVEAYRSTPTDKSQHPVVRMRDSDRARQASTLAPGEEKVTSRQLFNEYDDHFNRNLDMMSDGLSRLKGLGLVLRTEIETQNDQIERINENVARADDKIVVQTKRINNQLKK